MPTPFIDKDFTFTQPDGTKFKVIGTGNQYCANFHTPDGYLIIRDPASNFYHYAQLDETNSKFLPSGLRAGLDNPSRGTLVPDLQLPRSVTRGSGQPDTGLTRTPSRWQTRRAERLEDLKRALEVRGAGLAPPTRHTVGHYVGLCFLVQFPDVAGTISQSEVEAFCNAQGYTGFRNNGSVNDYYRDNSDGKLNYTNLVIPYYTAKHPKSYYVDPNIPYPLRAQELVTEALDNLLASGLGTSALTVDHSNYIFAVNIFYAGDVENNWSQGLWPHSFHLNTPYALATNKLAYDYQITNLGSELTLGTFCHENGHMVCDFPDLYSYDNGWNGVGGFCLMCSGGIYPNEKNPVQISAYLKNAAGWTSSLKVLTPGATVTLHSGRNDFAIYRRNLKEYFIIENREQAGRDAGLQTEG